METILRKIRHLYLSDPLMPYLLPSQDKFMPEENLNSYNHESYDHALVTTLYSVIQLIIVSFISQVSSQNHRNSMFFALQSLTFIGLTLVSIILTCLFREGAPLKFYNLALVLRLLIDIYFASQFFQIIMSGVGPRRSSQNGYQKYAKIWILVFLLCIIYYESNVLISINFQHIKFVL